MGNKQEIINAVQKLSKKQSEGALGYMLNEKGKLIPVTNLIIKELRKNNGKA
jgi:hypothetical protein